MSSQDRGNGSVRGVDGVTRRDAGRVIVVTAVSAAAGMALSSSVLAQDRRRPQAPATEAGVPAPKPSFLDNALRRSGREKHWVLTYEVTITAYQRTDNRGFPVTAPLQFETAAAVFPIIAGCASSEMEIDNASQIRSAFTMDGVSVEASPGLQGGYPAGTRLARWEMRNMRGNTARLNIELPMTCWDTELDERVAERAKWPTGQWPPEAASCFVAQTGIEPDAPEVRELVTEWSRGRDPKSVEPLTLAKYFMGRVVDMFQISGDGTRTARNGLIEGFDLAGAGNAARARRGSEHDMACLLASAYLAAGLPARTVIGYDDRAASGSDRSPLARGSRSRALRSWVEFALYDEDAEKLVWIPADVARMRRASSRAPDLTRAWRFFGTHNELKDIMPFAFQFHPPAAGVVAHGSPAVWGWMTTPTYQVADQSIRFITRTQVRTRDGREGERRR